VDGDIRMFGNTIILNGNVAKSATVFTESLDIDSKTQIGGSLISFSKSLDVDGRIARDALAHFDDARINGYVGGTADLAGRRLNISSNAEITGPVEFDGIEQPNVSSQAKLAAGPVKFKKIEPKPKYSDWRFYRRKVLSWGAGLMFGVLLILLFPDFMKDSVRQAARYGPAFGAGAVTLVAAPILAIIACITVVGLAIGIAGVLLYAVALFAAQIFVGLWLGERILGRGETQMGAIGRLAVGLLIVRIAGNLPAVSGIVWLVILAWGLGAMTLAIGRRLRPEPVYVPSEPSAPLPAASV
jgi:hypothetical protein